MTVQFKKATRFQVPLKLAITGATGSGKTYSALLIAKGLQEKLPGNPKIALVDTENGSASLYAGKEEMPEFDTLEIEPPFSVGKYLEAIRAAEKDYGILVIDSASHQWAGTGGTIDQLSKLRESNPRANSFTHWDKLTPDHEKFKDAIIQSPLHVIATMRSKMAYEMEKDEKGRTVPRKVGLAPIQRDGVEYEFTVVWDMSDTHYASTTKDRTDLFRDVIEKPTPEYGHKLAAWLAGGEVAPKKEPKVEPIPPANPHKWLAQTQVLAKRNGLRSAQVIDLLNKEFGVNRVMELPTEEKFQEFFSKLSLLAPSNVEQPKGE